MSAAHPRIGGYVIHGNNSSTLGRCLDDLMRVCDEVVAVDSQSTDGSADLVRQRGLMVITHPWEGYGAARARAVQALQGMDYVFFLDSDESLGPGAEAAFSTWRAAAPNLPHYTLQRRDWVDAPNGQRFVFRTEERKRLVRLDCATWSPDMIVHEALPRRRSARLLGTYIDHVFCSDLTQLAAKLHVYALLWAVRFFDGRQGTSWLPGLRRLSYLVRYALFKGALWRGGKLGFQVAWTVADYHALKYRYRAALRAGLCTDLVLAFRDRQYQALHAAAPAAVKLMRRML